MAAKASSNGYDFSAFTINTHTSTQEQHRVQEIKMGLVKTFDVYLMIVMLAGLVFALGLSNGYKFYVGKMVGFLLLPRIILIGLTETGFKSTTLFYPKGKDSVLEVSEEEYNTCNTTHPITSVSDGGSLFVLSRSGPFFFVSGNSENCLKGQKLAVNVMSTAHHSRSPRQPSPSPSPSPSPTLSPIAWSSPAPSPGVVLSDSEALAPAPEPAKARNSACLVGPGMVSLGLVLFVFIRSMV
ncbi:LOW QUALITY PROTEIN: hypothetical protein HID58_030001 [Brassica napus]|uniref:Phytocyanin domain-containing protein n=1 Tax=Brassica napus TaxID=3708 RepID=A0ABQ8CEP7_BRANA|nr:LOW QUALITY PROTEIN: hypothetical protein HID58_030001 [Brassica napus]